MKLRWRWRGALPWLFFIVAATLVNQSTPAGPMGHAAELAATLALSALHLRLVALFQGWLERRVRPTVGFVLTTVAAALLGAAIALTLFHFAPAYFEGGTVESVLASGVMTGMMLLALYVLTVRYPRVVEEVHARRLEGELAALKARFEPHFLLNSLNAIAGLVSTEPGRAREAIAALGELLSDALEEPAGQPHTVAREVAWLRAYLTIFQARYGDALCVGWHINPDLEQVVLPRLLVQPLVENALVHGIAATAGGEVTVTFRQAPQGALVIEVANSGPPAVPDQLVDGHGLWLVKRRLELEAPGGHFELHARPGPTGGTVATLQLPAED